MTTPGSVISLAGQLTDPKDRQTYAALISYVNSLPPGDEFVRLAELLGLVSLLGQRVPAAMAEFIRELRAQATAAADYHGQVDARLAGLPSEIAAGVDVAGVARGMSVAFRQQLAATGLHDTAALLKAATITMKQLSGELTATLKPATSEYRGIASTISSETAKLVTAARKVEEHNNRLIQEKVEDGWIMKALIVMIVFLLGGFCGILVEKRQTADALANIDSQIEHVQTPALPSPMEQTPKRNRKQSGL